MNRAILFPLSALLVIACATAWWLGLPKSKQEKDAEYLRRLAEQVRTDEKALRTYAASIVAGEVAKSKGLVTYSPAPLKQTGIAHRVHAVSKDENDNVYFILTDSFVTFNVGFILRNRAAELLGDSCEPRITHQERLFGDWWYYKTH